LAVIVWPAGMVMSARFWMPLAVKKLVAGAAMTSVPALTSRPAKVPAE